MKSMRCIRNVVHGALVSTKAACRHSMARCGGGHRMRPKAMQSGRNRGICPNERIRNKMCPTIVRPLNLAPSWGKSNLQDSKAPLQKQEAAHSSAKRLATSRVSPGALSGFGAGVTLRGRGLIRDLPEACGRRPCP